MTKYEEILNYISTKYIANEAYQFRKLPSIRQLSTTLHCSHNSVIRAYSELEQQHIIFSIPQSGFYILHEPNSFVEKNNMINLVKSNPDASVLPYREFEHCINLAVDTYKEALFLYPKAKGFPPLCKTLKALLLNRQVYVEENQICITNGVQQAIGLLFSLKPDATKDTLILETPGYPLAKELAIQNNWKIEFVSRNHKGIDLKALQSYFATGHVQYFYLMPRFHNPTGSSLSDRQKKRIIELAQKYDVYLIEDDYLAELDPIHNRLPLHYYDTNNKVIYLTGFSKSFMPGLRIGASCIPPMLLDQFIYSRYIEDIGTSTFLQGALNLYIQNGMYQRHCKKIVQVYRKKMQICQTYYKKYKDKISATLIVPESGYYLLITLPCSNFSSSHQVDYLVENLKTKGVLVSSGNRYFFENIKVPSICLSISNCTIDQLKEALTIIFEELCQYH